MEHYVLLQIHSARKVIIQKRNKREKFISCSVYAYRGLAR